MSKKRIGLPAFLTTFLFSQAALAFYGKGGVKFTEKQKKF